MIRILRICTVLVFTVTVVLFGLFFAKERSSQDHTLPTITIESETMSVSIHDAQDVLMTGVTAYDEKDGDLTSKIVIESVSPFDEDKNCVVTYAVMDGDKHVAKNSRTICYTDYTAPTFYLNQPLMFQLGDTVDIRQVVGAVDCMDGDISDRITIVATDYTNNTTGVFAISLQVTNSMGDIVYLDLPIYVIEEVSLRAPVIELSEYLIYVNPGENPVFENYVSSVSVNYVEVDSYNLFVSTNFDSSTPGTYSVGFTVENEDGQVGRNYLTVIVRG